MIIIKGCEQIAKEVERVSRSLTEQKEVVLKDLMKQGVDISKLMLEKQHIQYKLSGGNNPYICQLYRFIMREDTAS